MIPKKWENIYRRPNEKRQKHGRHQYDRRVCGIFIWKLGSYVLMSVSSLISHFSEIHTDRSSWTSQDSWLTCFIYIMVGDMIVSGTIYIATTTYHFPRIHIWLVRSFLCQTLAHQLWISITLCLPSHGNFDMVLPPKVYLYPFSLHLNLFKLVECSWVFFFAL